MISLFFKYIFLMFIFFGVFQFLIYKTKINADFVPFVAVTAIGLLMYLGGLLNIMHEMVVFIGLFSAISVIYIYLKERRLMSVTSLGVGYFFIGSLVMAIILKGHRFFAYDDFSHWGLVSREMLLNNRLPNFSDSIITFQAYPTGSAGFIYFISKVLGESEGIMLYAQSLIYLSCISPMLSILNKRKIHHYIILLFFSIYLFTGNEGIRTLYVDAVLTSITLALTVIILYYYREENIDQALIPLLLGNSFIVIVKNSGLLFSLITTILFLYLKMKKRSFSNTPLVLMTVTMPFFTRHLWDRHTKLVFPSAQESKHSLSVENYQEVFGLKTPEEIDIIVNNLIERSTGIEYVEVRYIFLILLFLGVIILVNFGKRHFNENIKPPIYTLNIFLSVFVLYVVYQLGLLGTYLFSMPTSEALKLAGYGRYNLTMTTYLLGFFVVCYYFKDTETTSLYSFKTKKYISSFVVILMGAILFNTKDTIIKAVTNSEFQDNPRSEMVSLLSQSIVNNNVRQIVYVSDLLESYSWDYLYYQLKYDLHSDDFEIIADRDGERLADMIEQENMNLIILKEDQNSEKIKN